MKKSARKSRYCFSVTGNFLPNERSRFLKLGARWVPTPALPNVPGAGTPYAQRVVQPFTAQPFPAHAFYVTDVVLGNPGGGKGTVTLTLGGAPFLVEPLTGVNAAAVKLSTPLLVQRDQTLAVHTSCTQDPCTPSVFVSGFAPARPPDSTD